LTGKVPVVPHFRKKQAVRFIIGSIVEVLPLAAQHSPVDGMPGVSLQLYPVFPFFPDDQAASDPAIAAG